MEANVQITDFEEFKNEINNKYNIISKMVMTEMVPKIKFLDETSRLSRDQLSKAIQSIDHMQNELRELGLDIANQASSGQKGASNPFQKLLSLRGTGSFRSSKSSK